MIRIPTIADAPMQTKAYAYFRGCDFTTDPAEIDDTRSPDCLNMIADDAGFPVKRIGWRVVTTLGDKIHSMIFAHFAGVTNPCIVVHHGTKLTAYDFTANTSTVLSSGMANHDSAMFLHGGKLYTLDGAKFQRFYYDSGAYTSEEVKNVAKTPTTGVLGHYEAIGGGNYNWVPCEADEEPNLLSSSQINTLAGDAIHKNFWLTEHGASVTKVEQYINDEWTEIADTNYSTSEDATLHKTKLTFTTAPAAHPDGAGIDNIRVTFTSTMNPASTAQIEKCCMATQYGYFNDNRFFVAGNPDKKHRDYACGVDDPTYWEKNQWTDVGSDQTAIMGYLHYGDVLAIIKEDDNQDAEVYIRSASVQSDQSVLFPVQQGVKGVGAISKHAFGSLRDDALFYAREGVFAIAGTDASQQRTVQNRSYFVDNKLRNEPKKDGACAAVWQNRFLLAFPDTGHCYVADARMQSGMNESFVYEWFYWENIHACRFLEFDGNLYFGTTDGKLCKFNDDLGSQLKYSDGLTRVATPIDTAERHNWENGVAIPARWTTRADAFGTFSHQKSLSKHGCTVMLRPYGQSTSSVYYSTDSAYKQFVCDVDMTAWDFAELDFGNINFSSMDSPRIAAMHKKVKRFQTLQIIIENANNEEPFGLYGIQLQYMVNNYIK